MEQPRGQPAPVLGGVVMFLVALLVPALVLVLLWNRYTRPRWVARGRRSTGRLFWRRAGAEAGRGSSLLFGSVMRTGSGRRPGWESPNRRTGARAAGPSTGWTSFHRRPAPAPGDPIQRLRQHEHLGALLGFRRRGRWRRRGSRGGASSRSASARPTSADLRAARSSSASGHHYAAAATTSMGRPKGSRSCRGHKESEGPARWRRFGVPKARGGCSGGTELLFAESGGRTARPGWPVRSAWYALAPVAAVSGKIVYSSTLRGIWRRPSSRRVELALDGSGRPRESGEGRGVSHEKRRTFTFGRRRGSARRATWGRSWSRWSWRWRRSVPRRLQLPRSGPPVSARRHAWVPGRCASSAGPSFERTDQPAPSPRGRGGVPPGKVASGHLGVSASYAAATRGLGTIPRPRRRRRSLALGEMGRWEYAAVEIDRFEVVSGPGVGAWRTFARTSPARALRRPHRIVEARRTSDPGSTVSGDSRRAASSARYGGAPLRSRAARSGECADVAPLLASLRAELLFDTGLVAEGKALAAEAAADATREAAADVGIRAHTSRSSSREPGAAGRCAAGPLEQQDGGDAEADGAAEFPAFEVASIARSSIDGTRALVRPDGRPAALAALPRRTAHALRSERPTPRLDALIRIASEATWTGSPLSATRRPLSSVYGRPVVERVGALRS